ncbi:MAG: hypothetical protein J6Y90_07430 [Lachnospiraceae bacterium]|nr:hypothetical protein [Lachnospiraceae bacterium]
MATDKKLKRKAEREKANRAEKMELMLWRVGIAAVAVAFFVGVGVTFVNMYRNYVASQPNYDSTEMVVGDLTGVLQATEADLQVIPGEADETVDELAVVEDGDTVEEATSEGEAAVVDAGETVEDGGEIVEGETETGADEAGADDEAVETAEAVAAE